jgi:hypothetical protein
MRYGINIEAINEQMLTPLGPMGVEKIYDRFSAILCST